MVFMVFLCDPYDIMDPLGSLIMKIALINHISPMSGHSYDMCGGELLAQRRLKEEGLWMMEG